MDGLPLALEQVGAYVASMRVDFENCYTYFLARQKEILEKYPPTADKYERTVATTWSMNFDEVKLL